MLCPSLSSYTSNQAYKIFVKKFSLTSLNLLNKDGLEPIKLVEALSLQGKIGSDIVLLLDSVCLQRDAQYKGS